MRKRILMLFGIFLCIGSMISCKEQEKQIEEEKLKEGTLFIGEEMYDLTEEPKDVIGSMVTNGCVVVETVTGYLYDTNGKLSDKAFRNLKSEGTDVGDVLEVHIDNVSATYSSNVILAEFLFANKDVNYRTWDGITRYSEEEDIKRLEDYVPCAVSADRTSYACIYADGNPISRQAYKETLEVLMNAREDNQLKETFKEYLKEVSYVPKAITCLRRKGMDGLGDDFDNEEIEGALWIILAAQDAGRMLDSEEITSYDIVVYEKKEDGMWCNVYHYYYDDAWDAGMYLQ